MGETVKVVLIVIAAYLGLRWLSSRNGVSGSLTMQGATWGGGMYGPTGSSYLNTYGMLPQYGYPGGYFGQPLPQFAASYSPDDNSFSVQYGAAF